MILQNHSAGKSPRTEFVSICAVPAADASSRADRDQTPLAIRIRIANVVLISRRKKLRADPTSVPKRHPLKQPVVRRVGSVLSKPPPER